MNRYDIEAWTCFVAFMFAIAMGSRLAGVAGVALVVVVAFGALYWAGQQGYLRDRNAEDAPRYSGLSTNEGERPDSNQDPE